MPMPELLERIGAFATDTRAAQHDTVRRLVYAHAITGMLWGGGWRYRRARILRDGKTATNVSDLIWREGVLPMIGRANAAGFGVVYLGSRRDTALSEVRAVDDDVVLSEFVIRRNLEMLVAPIGEMIQVQRTGRGFLAGDASRHLSDMINSCERDAAKAMLITDAFLLRVLTETENDYEKSSMVAMAIYEKLPGLTAVAFPSRRQFGGLNFAVRTDRFWDMWGVAMVRRARATLLAEGFYDLSEVRNGTGITHAGDIVWSDDIESESDQCLLLDPPWYPLHPTAISS